eukprot:1136866-Pelagomonas_calceolata.AAC.2
MSSPSCKALSQCEPWHKRKKREIGFKSTCKRQWHLKKYAGIAFITKPCMALGTEVKGSIQWMSACRSMQCMEKLMSKGPPLAKGMLPDGRIDAHRLQVWEVVAPGSPAGGRQNMPAGCTGQVRMGEAEALLPSVQIVRENLMKTG